LKDPYAFDFLTLGEAAHVRDLDRGLVEHVQKLLLEMGAGFAFVGRQVHLEVGDEDFHPICLPAARRSFRRSSGEINRAMLRGSRVWCLG
jgi:predicted nuclease of restriction endonuclease-like (RecB) superfamily